MKGQRRASGGAGEVNFLIWVLITRVYSPCENLQAVLLLLVYFLSVSVIGFKWLQILRHSSYQEVGAMSPSLDFGWVCDSLVTDRGWSE